MKLSNMTILSRVSVFAATALLTTTVGSAAACPATAAAGGDPTKLTSGLYVDPNSNPAKWARDNPGDPRAARVQSSIGAQPIGNWFGNWSGDIAKATAAYVQAADTKDKLPVLVAYNIPGRDCGGESGGGAGTPEKYRTWISQFAAGIGDKPAVVVIEPDALAQVDCLKQDQRQTRLDLLKYAAEQLRAKATNTYAYMDGGNAKWIAAPTMAERLNAVGVSGIRGFTVNVSNYYRSDESKTYADAVSANLKSKFGYTKPYVIDTSRNGNGANGDWCNPPGRKLGQTPRVGGDADLTLWVKVPGDSDGKCGSAPSIPAGQFSPDIAINLIDGK